MTKYFTELRSFVTTAGRVWTLLETARKFSQIHERNSCNKAYCDGFAASVDSLKSVRWSATFIDGTVESPTDNLAQSDWIKAVSEMFPMIGKTC